MVSPEDFGAVGDGITDDTVAWQNAIDSGQNVKATKTQYKCGTLHVRTDITIDCNNAEFFATESILFDCSGEIVNTVSAQNYTANTANYNLGDGFTGIAHIKGTNNVFKQRPYYYGGTTEHFTNGKLDSTIPVDIENPSVYELKTIAVNILNIKNVEFSDETFAMIIKMQYTAYCVIENVNMTNVCYGVLSLYQCYKITYRNSSYDIPQYKTFGTNYYPIGIYDSCYTTVENINAHCVGWHCISTGGYTLCRQTHIKGCIFLIDYPTPAYADHENGVETTIEDTTSQSLCIGCGSIVKNCVVNRHSDRDYCFLIMHMNNTNDGFASYRIENTEFNPAAGQVNACIGVYCSPRETGLSADYYFHSLLVKDCVNNNPNRTIAVENQTRSTITGKKTIGEIIIANSNIDIKVNAKVRACSIRA